MNDDKKEPEPTEPQDTVEPEPKPEPELPEMGHPEFRGGRPDGEKHKLIER